MIPHRLNHPTVPLEFLPSYVFRSSLWFFLWPRSFRYCRIGFLSDAVTVYVLENISAMDFERPRRPVQYLQRSLGVSIQLVVRFNILDFQPDVVRHFDICVTAPQPAIKVCHVGDLSLFDIHSGALHRCCHFEDPVLLPCPCPSTSFVIISTYREVARL